MAIASSLALTDENIARVVEEFKKAMDESKDQLAAPGEEILPELVANLRETATSAR